MVSGVKEASHPHFTESTICPHCPTETKLQPLLPDPDPDPGPGTLPTQVKTSVQCTTLIFHSYFGLQRCLVCF